MDNQLQKHEENYYSIINSRWVQILADVELLAALHLPHVNQVWIVWKTDLRQVGVGWVGVVF